MLRFPCALPKIRSPQLACIFVLLSIFEGIGSLRVALSQDKPPEVKWIDASELVNSLASKNTPPTIVGFYTVKFEACAKFEWPEQGRVWRVVKKLIGNVEDAWPVLVEHLDDERYSVTVDFEGFDERYNWTVGDVCRQLVSRTLSEAYYQELKPRSLNLYRKMRYPGFGINRQELKKWCTARSDRSLYELQVETCGWAAGELADNATFFL
jgi:hypothetical protein